MESVRIGSVQVLAVSDGGISEPAERFFPETTAAAWGPYRRHLDEHGNVVLNVGSFVIRADGRTILVDTGLGPRVDVGRDVARLPDGLRNAGVSLEEIDFVLITHMHYDHIGWNTVEREGAYEPAFPRARYLLQRLEWAHWMQPRTEATPHIDEEDEANFALVATPLERAGVVDLVEGEHRVTPSVRFLPTPGHTPGHASILIDSGGEQAVILGDVAHNPAQVSEPDWPSGADEDRGQGRRSRNDLWRRVEEHGLTICAGHFGGGSFGRLVQVEGKRTWLAL